MTRRSLLFLAAVALLVGLAAVGLERPRPLLTLDWAKKADAAKPPVAVLMTGRILSFILSLLLTLLGWIPGVIQACLVVNDYQAERRR